MAEYTLYCFAQSGNCYKPALMLALCGADWAPRFVDYFNGETRSAEYRARVNAMGEAPVLEHQGRKLTQSGVILDYLVAKLGKFGWKDEDERREILRWILWDNHKLTSYTATYRFLVALTKDPEPKVLEFLRQRSAGALGILDAHLAKNDFAVGGRPTIADLSMCGYLYFNDEFGVTWEKDYPNIGKWLERIKALKGWAHPYKLMPGHPLPGAKT
jgi:glutathione S-transferase